MNEKWHLQLADDRFIDIKEYIWILVNVSDVKTIIKACILSKELVYNLLLSKR